MKKLLPFAVLLLFFAASALSATSFTVKPENSVIVAGPKTGAVQRLAAKELQY